MELRRSSREAPFPDRLSVHRKGKPGQQEEEPLAHELRCWSNRPQVHPFASMQSTTVDMLKIVILMPAAFFAVQAASTALMALPDL